MVDEDDGPLGGGGGEAGLGGGAARRAPARLVGEGVGVQEHLVRAQEVVLGGPVEGEELVAGERRVAGDHRERGLAGGRRLGLPPDVQERLRLR